MPKQNKTGNQYCDQYMYNKSKTCKLCMNTNCTYNINPIIIKQKESANEKLNPLNNYNPLEELSKLNLFD